MAKAGMKRPGRNSQPKIESNQKYHSNKNVVQPVPEIQDKNKN